MISMLKIKKKLTLPAKGIIREKRMNKKVVSYQIIPATQPLMQGQNTWLYTWCLPKLNVSST